MLGAKRRAVLPRVVCRWCATESRACLVQILPFCEKRGKRQDEERTLKYDPQGESAPRGEGSFEHAVYRFGRGIHENCPAISPILVVLLPVAASPFGS